MPVVLLPRLMMRLPASSTLYFKCCHKREHQNCLKCLSQITVVSTSLKPVATWGAGLAGWARPHPPPLVDLWHGSSAHTGPRLLLFLLLLFLPLKSGKDAFNPAQLEHISSSCKALSLALVCVRMRAAPSRWQPETSKHITTHT
jgi:hypothetical protein